MCDVEAIDEPSLAAPRNCEPEPAVAPPSTPLSSHSPRGPEVVLTHDPKDLKALAMLAGPPLVVERV